MGSPCERARTRPADSDGDELIGILREVAGRCEDGSTFPIDLVISEINIEDRRTYTLIGRNLSERRALEKEVLEASTREQQRISRDLHDRVGQELTGIGYLATSLSQELGALRRVQTATKIADGIQRVVGEVRSAIRGLTPVAIEDNGLMTALEELAARTREHFDIPCRFVWIPGGPDRRQPDCDAPVPHRKEAVHNAVKHARAKEIVVALKGGANTSRWKSATMVWGWLLKWNSARGWDCTSCDTVPARSARRSRSRASTDRHTGDLYSPQGRAHA